MDTRALVRRAVEPVDDRVVSGARRYPSTPPVGRTRRRLDRAPPGSLERHRARPRRPFVASRRRVWSTLGARRRRRMTSCSGRSVGPGSWGVRRRWSRDLVGDKRLASSTARIYRVDADGCHRADTERAYDPHMSDTDTQPTTTPPSTKTDAQRRAELTSEQYRVLLRRAPSARSAAPSGTSTVRASTAAPAAEPNFDF